MPIYDSKLIVHDGIIGQAGSEASSDDINTGVEGGTILDGLHIIVTETFTGLDCGCYIWIMGGYTSPPSLPTMCRIFFPPGFLPTGFPWNLDLGMHYFIPCPKIPFKFFGAYFEVGMGGTNATAGKLLMYFGPNEDGAL